MKRLPELRPTPWDTAVVLLILALALGCGAVVWGGTSIGLTAVVTVDGEEIDRFPLSASAGERQYAAHGYTLTAAASSDGIQVISSDCPTQDCVHTGTVSRSGQSIVCLPARWMLRLEGGAESDTSSVDVVIG